MAQGTRQSLEFAAPITLSLQNQATLVVGKVNGD
jgi:hypothetical protein